SLPHEVMHTVLATAVAHPVPRWADGGIALCAEPAAVQAQHDARIRELMNAGRGVRLRTLFRMTEYPPHLTVFYAQSHSVVRFLLARGPTDSYAKAVSRMNFPADHPVTDDVRRRFCLLMFLDLAQR